MTALRQLPPWFVICMLLGLAGFAGGIWLVADGLRVPPAARRVAPSFPNQLPPAEPPEPATVYTPPAVSGRPRSTPTRPAPSNIATPTPYRSASPSTAPHPIPSRRVRPTGSPDIPPTPRIW